MGVAGRVPAEVSNSLGGLVRCWLVAQAGVGLNEGHEAEPVIVLVIWIPRVGFQGGLVVRLGLVEGQPGRLEVSLSQAEER